PLGAAGFANYIPAVIEDDDLVTLGREALRPPHPVEDEKIAPLALYLGAPKGEERLALGLSLGGKADAELSGGADVHEVAQNVGVLHAPELQRVALGLLLDLGLSDGLRSIIGNCSGHDDHVGVLARAHHRRLELTSR